MFTKDGEHEYTFGGGRKNIFFRGTSGPSSVISKIPYDFAAGAPAVAIACWPITGKSLQSVSC